MKAGRKRVVSGKTKHLQGTALSLARSEACPLDLLVGPPGEPRSTHVVRHSVGSSAGGWGMTMRMNP